MPLNKRERTHLFFGFSSQNFSHVLFKKKLFRESTKEAFFGFDWNLFFFSGIEWMLHSNSFLFVKNFCRCCVSRIAFTIKMINDCRSPGWTGKRLSPGNRTRQFGRVDKIVSVASKYLNLIQHTLSSYYHTHKSLLQTRPLAPHRKKK